MRHAFLLAAALFLLNSLSGCGKEEKEEKLDLSAEEIVDNAMSALQEPITYYGEFEGNDGEYGDWMKYEEWSRSDGNVKVKRKDRMNQTVDMYDGEQLFLFDEENHMVAALKRSYKDIAANSHSLRLRSAFGLELAKDQCDLSVAGEEKVAGQKTYHIISQHKSDNACVGVPEYWIDQERWMVLKVFSNYHKDQQVTLQYTKVDFEAHITDEALAFDFPESAGVNTIVDPEESMLEEAKEKLRKFFLIPETAELRLEGITIYEENQEHPEFTFDYMKNGEPELSVTVLPAYGELLFEFADDEEIINIHGHEGLIKRNPEGIYNIWVENGMHYTVKTVNPELSEEELAQYVETMKRID